MLRRLVCIPTRRGRFEGEAGGCLGTDGLSRVLVWFGRTGARRRRGPRCFGRLTTCERRIGAMPLRIDPPRQALSRHSSEPRTTPLLSRLTFFRSRDENVDVRVQLKVGGGIVPGVDMAMVWSASKMPWYASQRLCFLAHLFFAGSVFQWLMLTRSGEFEYALVKSVEVAPSADSAGSSSAPAAMNTATDALLAAQNPAEPIVVFE